MSAVVPAVEEVGWRVTPYEARTDESAVLYHWTRSYAHSAYGVRQGANVKASDAARAFWEQHRALFLGLIARSTVTVARDVVSPGVIWGWTAAEGDTLHYAFVKRSVVDAGFGVEVMLDLLGDRLQRPQAYTLELVELRRLKGIRIPTSWYPDFTYHLRATP